MSNYSELRQAIIHRQQVTCIYQDRYRECCPHAIGTKNGRSHVTFTPALPDCGATALGTVRLAVVVSPTEPGKHPLGIFVAHARDLTEGQAPCRAAEEEVLGHLPSFGLMIFNLSEL